MFACSCGREQKVPTLSLLRRTALFNPEVVDKPEAHWNRGALLRSRPLRMALLLTSILAILGVGWFWFSFPPTPELPAVNLESADAEVIEEVEAARAAVERSPRSASAWGHLGMVLHANAIESAADASYAAAATLEPRNPDWHYLRGYLHQDGPAGPEKAIPLYQQAASLGPPNSVARLRLGDALLALGRFDSAEQEYGKVLSSDPHDPDATLGMASLAVARREYEQGLRLLEPIAEHPMVQKQAGELLATVHERLQNNAEAQRQRQRLATLPEDQSRPDDAMNEVGKLQVGLSGRMRKATMLRQQQRLAECLEELKDTVARYPDADEAWANLGAALQHTGDLAGAEQAMRKSIQLVPKSGEYHMNLGVLQLAQKRPEAATETFRKTIELQPTLAPAHFGLGESRKALGDQEGAIAAYRDSLRFGNNSLATQRLRELELDPKATSP